MCSRELYKLIDDYHFSRILSATRERKRNAAKATSDHPKESKHKYISGLYIVSAFGDFNSVVHQERQIHFKVQRLGVPSSTWWRSLCELTPMCRLHCPWRSPKPSAPYRRFIKCIYCWYPCSTLRKIGFLNIIPVYRSLHRSWPPYQYPWAHSWSATPRHILHPQMCR